jgi:hypothetical protein
LLGRESRHVREFISDRAASQRGAAFGLTR